MKKLLILFIILLSFNCSYASYQGIKVNTIIVDIHDGISTGTVGNFFVYNIGSTTNITAMFKIPSDFGSIKSFYLPNIPDATETYQFDVLISKTQAGQLYNASDTSSLNETKAVTINLITETDLTSYLPALAVGDYVSLVFEGDTDFIRGLFFVLEYYTKP